MPTIIHTSGTLKNVLKTLARISNTAGKYLFNFFLKNTSTPHLSRLAQAPVPASHSRPTRIPKMGQRVDLERHRHRSIMRRRARSQKDGKPRTS